MLRHAAALLLFFVAVACGTAGARPAGADVVARIELGPAPCSVARTAGAVWVMNFRGHNVQRIDPATSSVAATIDVGFGPFDIVAGHGSIWVTNSVDGTVS